MRKSRGTILLIFLTLSLVFNSGNAQDSGVGFIQYDQERGLNVSQILRIAEDQYRNLWMLTFGGKIIRFDGVSFQEFSLSDEVYTNNIYELTVSNQDTVWLLSDRGLLSFNGHDFVLHTKLEDLSTGYQSHLEVDKFDRLWILDNTGKVFVKVGSQYQDLNVTGIKSIVQNQGMVELWSSSEVMEVNRELNVVNKRAFTVQSPISHVIKNPENSNERILFTTQGFVRWNLTTGEVTATVKAPKKTWNVADAGIDYAGNMYVMANYELFTLAPDEQWAEFSKEEGFPEVKILTLLRDNAGYVWVGTDGKGLLRTQKKLLQLYKAPQNESIWKATRLNKDTILLGTFGNGIYGFTGYKFFQDQSWKIFNSLKVVAIEPFREGALIGTFGMGLWYLDKNFKLTKFIDDQKYPLLKFVSVIYKDHDTLYIGTIGGLVVVKDNEINEIEKGNTQPVMSIVKWNNKILVGFYDDGLHEFTGTKFQKVELKGLEKTSVNYFTIDSANRLWIASNRPFLLVWDSPNHEPHRISLSNVTEVNFLEFINPTNFLMGTEGSAYIQTVDSEQPKIIATRELTYSDGFIKASSSNGPVISEPPFLWFGTNKGLYRFDSRNHSGPTIDPIIYLTGVTIEGMSTIPATWYSQNTGFFGIPDNLSLPHTHNSISLSFQANDFSQGNQTNYRYKMQPIEDEWRSGGPGLQVTYSTLAPDKYTFIVQAQSSSGAWLSTEAYSFEIIPAFWQTKIFITLSSLSVVALVVFGVRNFMRKRIRQFKRDEKIRAESAKKVSEQVAMDFHDELGNKLAAIVAHTNALKLKQNRNDSDFESILNYVEDNAKQVYQGTRDFIWSIDMKSNNLKEVIYYIKDFGERLFSGNDVSFFVNENVTDFRNELFLKNGFGRHMVLFCKEALTNVYKHSECKNVWLKVHFDNDDVFVSIEDDGIGMNENGKAGNGLKNMQKRALRINGKFMFSNRKPNGVIIKLNFQL